jgi:hypothetical protein
MTDATAMWIAGPVFTQWYGTVDPLAYLDALRPVEPRSIDYER